MVPSSWRASWRAVLMLLMLLAGSVSAHEFRPGYLQIDDAPAARRYALTWRVAEADAAREALRLVAAPGCRLEASSRGVHDRMVLERYLLDCAQAREPWLAVEGLAASMTDVLVKRVDAQGERFEHLHASRARIDLAQSGDAAAPPPNLFAEGVWHVIGGYDHLAYILLLYLWLRRRGRDLVIGVSAFTVAHSASLALAMLGVLQVPARPVEAIIALTIGYFALAVARGQSAVEVPMRRWLPVVLACGLIHGLGFANSLADVGLARSGLVWGLLSFNLGIEVAQLAIVAVLASAALAVARAVSTGAIAAARHGTAVALGSVAVLWYLQRLVG